MVTAVNRGHDADTSGAITGQLAGRIYGIDGDKAIPDWMYEGLYAHQHLYDLACQLCDLSIRDSRVCTSRLRVNTPLREAITTFPLGFFLERSTISKS